MKFRAIFIDWGGTLSTSRFWEHWEKVMPDRFRLIQQHLFGANKDIVRNWMRGQLCAEDITRDLAKTLGADESEVFSELRRSCSQLKLVDPTILEIVKCIRAKGVKVVIATDNMDTFLRWTAPALKLSNNFDHILVSNSIFALKGDTAADGSSLFFSRYLESNALRPEETVLIDDDAPYVENFGIKYLQVNNEQNLVGHLEYLNEQF